MSRIGEAIADVMDRSVKLEAQVAALTKQRDELRAACKGMLAAFEYAGTRLVGAEYEARNQLAAALANTEEA